MGTVGTGVTMMGGAALGGLYAHLAHLEFTALAAVGMGAFGGLIAGALPLIIIETVSLTRLVKNNFIIKTVANSYDGKGKNLRKFRRKLLKKYPELTARASEESIAKLLVRADKELTLCNGTLVERESRSYFRKNLAQKSDLFKFLKTEL